MSESILQVSDLGVRFGGVQALAGVALKVSAGSVHGLIGPNGAGKTTLLNCITGLIRPDTGKVRFRQHDLHALRPDAIIGLGIARTFQNFGLMEDLSVLDNVIAGLHSRNPCSILDELVLLTRRNRAARQMRAIVQEHLGLAGMSALADVLVRNLSYGQRKAVELVRASAVKPDLLLLDEPTAGLSDQEMRELKVRLNTMCRDYGTTLLIISHHMEFLLGIADEVTVLNLGTLVTSGTPQAIKSDPAVIAAYLGSED